MDKRKQAMIQQLVQQIEHQLGWGNGEEWSNKDFEALSEQIFETTKKRLSVTTLKRIWGRAEMVAKPSTATLDIISEFVGYESWRDYLAVKGQLSQSGTVHRKIFTKLAIIIVSLIGVAVLTVIFWPRKEVEVKPAVVLNTSDFAFESKVVSTGLPNSVVFSYDASAAEADAKIQIQQDWDKRKRIQINKDDSVATCIYYRPGFFKSKLVVDGTIVKEKDVFIKTEGWLGTINKDSVPIYLNGKEVLYDGHSGISLNTLGAFGIDPMMTEVTTSLYYINDFPKLHTNDFEASMLLKNSHDKTMGGCQEIEVYVIYDGGVIGLPLARKGCISNLNLMAFNRYIDGKKNDLSSFGVDFDDFVELSCTVTEELLRIYVNGALALELPKENASYTIKGISVHFQGTGTIKDVVLKNSTGAIYALN